MTLQASADCDGEGLSKDEAKKLAQGGDWVQMGDSGKSSEFSARDSQGSVGRLYM